eukprot:6515848-Prymnesium_polylepis.1
MKDSRSAPHTSHMPCDTMATAARPPLLQTSPAALNADRSHGGPAPKKSEPSHSRSIATWTGVPSSRHRGTASRTAASTESTEPAKYLTAAHCTAPRCARASASATPAAKPTIVSSGKCFPLATRAQPTRNGHTNRESVRLSPHRVAAGKRVPFSEQAVEGALLDILRPGAPEGKLGGLLDECHHAHVAKELRAGGGAEDAGERKHEREWKPDGFVGREAEDGGGERERLVRGGDYIAPTADALVEREERCQH